MINVWALSRQYLFAQHENNERRNEMKKKKWEKNYESRKKHIGAGFKHHIISTQFVRVVKWFFIINTMPLLLLFPELAPMVSSI